VKARMALPPVALAAGYAELQWLGRTYGATAPERRRRLPGDDVCPHPQAVTTHAITIDAHPSRVWPWLVQMGWGRGQWYTARWVDQLFFPNNGPSADKIIPELQRLRVGDLIGTISVPHVAARPSTVQALAVGEATRRAGLAPHEATARHAASTTIPSRATLCQARLPPLPEINVVLMASSPAQSWCKR